MFSDVAYKKIIVVMVVVFGATLVASVLATYFAKRPKNDDNSKFLDYICQNLSYIKEIGNFCHGTTPPPIISDSTEGPTYQLPTNLVPTAYDLNYNFFAEPNEEPDHFTCDETIYFTCRKSTDTLVMHMKELNVDNSSFVLTLLNDSNPYSANLIRQPVSWSYDVDKQFMLIKFGQYVFASNSSYSLRVVFQAPFRNDATGLYKTFYTNQLKNTRWLVMLEALPTSARKAFICFDEPQYKARFKISVIHTSTLNVLSNMPARSIENANISLLRMRTEFEQTPVVSSFLVGLVMSDFKCTTTSAQVGANNSSVSVCSAPDSVAKLDYSLGLSKSLLEFFEKAFDFKYPLAKCDIMALPKQNLNGKSNWGLIFMKDELVFNDVKTFSQESLQRNFLQMSKQISQQWFGDLTTPRWWNDFWLFESFNSYVSFTSASSINANLNMLEQLVIDQLSIMNEDAFNPILIDSQTLNQSLTQYLDERAVLKATSLMRMGNYILGIDTFSKGFSTFVKSSVFSNARQNNFWDLFTSVSSLNGLNLSNVMYSWTRQAGHPIVNLRKLNSTHVSVSQAQFTIDPFAAGVQKWYIPFSYVVVDNITSRNVDLFNITLANFNTKITLLSPDTPEVIISLPKPMDNQSYLLGNLEVAALCRVNYDNQNWDLIIQQLITSKNNIPPRMRAQLINDMFAFLQANLVDPLKPFNLLAYLSTEDNYLAWQAAIKQITYLKDLVDTTPIYDRFRNYAIKLVTPIYTKLGWNENINDSWLDKLLRNSILEFACALEIDDCIQKSIKFFNDWVSNSVSNSVPIAFQRFVYCNGIEFGTVNGWKFTLNQFTLETDPTLKDNLLYGLSCSREPWLIQTYLDNQINPDFFVSEQTLFKAIRYSSRKNYAYLINWEFVKKNWDSIYSKYGAQPSFRGLITDLTRKFASQDLLAELGDFFKSKKLSSSSRDELNMASNRIALNLKWLADMYEPLSKWLTNQ